MREKERPFAQGPYTAMQPLGQVGFGVSGTKTPRDFASTATGSAFLAVGRLATQLLPRRRWLRARHRPACRAPRDRNAWTADRRRFRPSRCSRPFFRRGEVDPGEDLVIGLRRDEAGERRLVRIVDDEHGRVDIVGRDLVGARLAAGREVSTTLPDCRSTTLTLLSPSPPRAGRAAARSLPRSGPPCHSISTARRNLRCASSASAT